MDEDLYEHIIQIALRICPDDYDHMDLAHDAVVEIMECQDQWDGRGTYKSWASIAAVHEMIDILRRHRKKPEFEGAYRYLNPGVAYNT